VNILINGDSNMSGEELQDKSLSIGSQLCKMLGGTEINIALSGASNDRIYDTTMNYVQTNSDIDLVVIGWSEMYRVQWFVVDNNQPEFVEVNNLGINNSKYPEEYQRRLEHWKISADDDKRREGLSHYWHERIFNLHKYLEHLKIPHLFFHAFYDFNIYYPQYQLDWNNRFMDPYGHQSSYTRWSALNGFKEITPGWYHYEPAAQQAWAERLYNHIHQYSILN
jgi:hypothetical protein